MADEKTKSTSANGAVEAVPSSWPGAFGVFKHSKQAVMTNLSNIVIFWALNLVVGFVFQLVFKNAIGQAASDLVSVLLSVILTILYLDGVRQKQSDFNEVLNKSVKLWVNMILLDILIFFVIFASIIALVIPFFFIAPRTVLANYYLVDKNMGPVEAFKASWDATKGNVGKVYGIVGVSLLMLLPVITIVGIVLTVYLLILYSAVFAVLYAYLLKKPAAAKAVEAA